MVSKIKNTLDGTKSNWDITKENISGTEDQATSICCSSYWYINVGKDWKKIMKRVSKVVGQCKIVNIRIIELPEGES